MCWCRPSDTRPSAPGGRQCQLMRIPVHVVGNIEVVVLVAVFILEIASAVHDADKTACVFHLGEPGSLAVEGHIRAAVGFVVDEARLAFAVQRRMRLPEGDCCFYKGGKLRIPGGCFPVDPAGFVSWHQALLLPFWLLPNSSPP